MWPVLVLWALLAPVGALPCVPLTPCTMAHDTNTTGVDAGSGLVVADLNDDGRSDVLLRQHDGTIAAFVQRTDGSFHPALGVAQNASLAAVDRDGRIYTATDAGIVLAGSVVCNVTNVSALLLADVDNSSSLDVVAGQADGTVLWCNDTAAPQLLTQGTAATSPQLQAVDTDGDGAVEILVTLPGYALMVGNSTVNLTSFVPDDVVAWPDAGCVGMAVRTNHTVTMLSCNCSAGDIVCDTNGTVLYDDALTMHWTSLEGELLVVRASGVVVRWPSNVSVSAAAPTDAAAAGDILAVLDGNDTVLAHYESLQGQCTDRACAPVVRSYGAYDITQAPTADGGYVTVAMSPPILAVLPGTSGVFSVRVDAPLVAHPVSATVRGCNDTQDVVDMIVGFDANGVLEDTITLGYANVVDGQAGRLCLAVTSSGGDAVSVALSPALFALPPTTTTTTTTLPATTTSSTSTTTLPATTTSSTSTTTTTTPTTILPTTLTATSTPPDPVATTTTTSTAPPTSTSTTTLPATTTTSTSTAPPTSTSTTTLPATTTTTSTTSAAAMTTTTTVPVGATGGFGYAVTRMVVRDGQVQRAVGAGDVALAAYDALYVMAEQADTAWDTLLVVVNSTRPTTVTPASYVGAGCVHSGSCAHTIHPVVHNGTHVCRVARAVFMPDTTWWIAITVGSSATVHSVSWTADTAVSDTHVVEVYDDNNTAPSTPPVDDSAIWLHTRLRAVLVSPAAYTGTTVYTVNFSVLATAERTVDMHVALLSSINDTAVSTVVVRRQVSPHAYTEFTLDVAWFEVSNSTVTVLMLTSSSAAPLFVRMQSRPVAATTMGLAPTVDDWRYVLHDGSTRRRLSPWHHDAMVMQLDPGHVALMRLEGAGSAHHYTTIGLDCWARANAAVTMQWYSAAFLPASPPCAATVDVLENNGVAIYARCENPNRTAWIGVRSSVPVTCDRFRWAQVTGQNTSVIGAHVLLSENSMRGPLSGAVELAVGEMLDIMHGFPRADAWSHLQFSVPVTLADAGTYVFLFMFDASYVCAAAQTCATTLTRRHSATANSTVNITVTVPQVAVVYGMRMIMMAITAPPDTVYVVHLDATLSVYATRPGGSRPPPAARLVNQTRAETATTTIYDAAPLLPTPWLAPAHHTGLADVRILVLSADTVPVTCVRIAVVTLTRTVHEWRRTTRTSSDTWTAVVQRVWFPSDEPAWLALSTCDTVQRRTAGAATWTQLGDDWQTTADPLADGDDDDDDNNDANITLLWQCLLVSLTILVVAAVVYRFRR